MDIDKIKAQLHKVEVSVRAFEDATSTGSHGQQAPHVSTAALQGRLQSAMRDMQIAVEGPQKYIETLRTEVGIDL